MKRIVLTILGFAFITASAQSVDDIMQKYIANIGGLEAFNAVKTAKMTGTLTVQGTDLQLTNQIINGRAMRTDIDVMGQSITNAYIDGKGWKVNPVSPTPDVMDVTGDELLEFKSQSSLAGELMDYKARGHKLDYEGKEKVDGVETYKLTLKNKENGKKYDYYLSTADYSMVKSVGTREFNGQNYEVETFHKNYKTFGGLKFSTERVSMVQGNVIQEVKLDNIELNIPIDEKIFSKQ